MRKFTISGLLTLCLLLAVTSLFAQRTQVDVPKVDPSAMTIDGKSDEAAWSTAATANVVTSTGFNGWFNYYYRDVVEPDYIELWSKMLWARDTLYVFIHIKDQVNDSTGLYWNPDNHWASDQLFVSLSSRLGREMQGWYDGNIYAAPEGPYHFLILGNRVTLNDSTESGIPDEYKKFPDDTSRVFNAHDISRSATTVNEATGEWDIEMAIYHPNVAPGANLGFNFGGSQSSFVSDTTFGDGYAYWTWQPNKPDEPFATPDLVLSDTLLPQDPGGYNLINSQAWALLRFDTTAVVTSISPFDPQAGIPVAFVLGQNYPNPFNPSTRIQFALPRAGKVEMKVYNVLGQVVATLVNGQYATGKYAVEWNAHQLASGVYFYRLTVDNNVIDTKKMMLLK